MHIFVTGATGLVGARLCRALLARGDSVVALSRSRRSGGGLAWVHGSHDDLDAWEKAVDGCDAVVNLAGEPVAGRWTRARMQRIVTSRVGITTALCHAIGNAEKRPSVLVSASAVGYYGTAAETTLDESSPPGSGFLAGVCEQWEAAARRSEALGPRVVRLRLGMVLAGEGGALPKLAGVLPFFAGGALGNGSQWISWIQIDDLVALILHALDDATLAGAVNAVTPEPIRQRDLARAIGRVTGKPLWLDAPGFLLKLALGRMAEEMLLAGQRVVPRRTLDSGFEYTYTEVDAALRAELGRSET